MTGTVNTSTANFLSIDRDSADVILGGNDFISGSLKNSTGAAIEYKAGTLLGRVSTTGDLKVLESTAVDGSQFVVGILAETFTIDGGSAQSVPVAVSGMIDEDMVIFGAADSLSKFDAVVSGRRLRDRIAGDTQGIELVKSTQLSGFDN